MADEFEWEQGGVADMRGGRFDEIRAALSSLIIAIRSMSKEPGLGASGAGEVLLLYGRAQDYLWTLKTLCRAEQSQDARGVRGSEGAHEAARLENQLDTAFLPVLKLLAGDESLAEDSELGRWKRRLFEQKGCWASNPEGLARLQRVLLPIKSMHAHLLNAMQLTVETGYGYPAKKTFSQAISDLKTSGDAVLTTGLFFHMSGWCAERAPLFADILNAVYGWRCNESAPPLSPYETAIRRERCDPESVGAMLQTLFERSQELQALVARSCGVPEGEKTPVARLFCQDAGAGAAVSAFCDYGRFFDYAKRTFGVLEPAFCEFLDQAISGHWIEARNTSGRAGGAWCDNLPSEKAMLIFLKKAQGPAALSQLMHLLGVGFMHWVLQGAESSLRRMPLSMTEVAGMLCETAVERMLAGASPAFSPAIRAQSMKRLVNMTLALPMRHRLAKKLLEERERGVISVSRINELSREAWSESFGDSVDGCNQYVWAYKHHFYRTDVMFYDWQYTFGFLLSQLLFERFAKLPQGSVKPFLQDAARLSCEALVERFLGFNIRKKDAWLLAVDSALSFAASPEASGAKEGA